MKVERKTAQAIASIAVLSLLMCGGVFAYSTRVAQALSMGAPAASTSVTEQEKVEVSDSQTHTREGEVSDSQTHTNEGEQNEHQLPFQLVAVASGDNIKGHAEIEIMGLDVRVQLQIEQAKPNTDYTVTLYDAQNANQAPSSSFCRSGMKFTTDDGGAAEVRFTANPHSQGTFFESLEVCTGSTPVLEPDPPALQAVFAPLTTHETEETKQVNEHEDDAATEKEIDDAETSGKIPAKVDVSSSDETVTQIDPKFSVSVTRPTANSLDVSISGVNGTGPRVLEINLGKDAGPLSSLSTISLTYDGTPVAEASSVSQVFQGAATDSPSFAVLLTANGTKLLVFVPHFSVHEIELTVPAAAFGSIVAQAPLLLAGVAAVAAVSAVVYLRRKRFTAAAPSL